MQGQGTCATCDKMDLMTGFKGKARPVGEEGPMTIPVGPHSKAFATPHCYYNTCNRDCLVQYTALLAGLHLLYSDPS